MSEHEPQFPGLLRRLAAGFYDSLLVLAIWFLATLLLLPLTGGEAVENHRLAYLLYLLALTGLFFVWFWHRSGQTLGMQAWRIHLSDNNGRRPALSALILRAALILLLVLAALYGLAALAIEELPQWFGLIALLPLVLSMAWCLVDKRGCSLHDRASGTQMRLLPKN